MKRGWFGLLLAAVLLTLSLPAGAAEWTGTVEVKLDAGELPVTNGSVTLYPVGFLTEDGYRLLDRYGGGVIRREDLGSENMISWISELADGGRELLLDVDGRAVFSRVEEGLYLMKQEERMDGFYPFRPFLIQMPDAGRWAQLVQPKNSPIVEECPCTGDMATMLAVVAMVLSGGGLACCGIWGKREEKRKKF